MSNGYFDRVRWHQRNVGCRPSGDVLRQLEMDRAWPLLLRNPERLAHDRGDCRRADDLVRHLGQRRHGRDHVHNLEACLLPAQNPLLASDHDHGHGAEQSEGGARGQIERAGTKRREADSGPAGQPSVGCCHEGGRLLMAGHYERDPGATQRIDDVEVFFSGYAEDVLHTFVLQCGYEQVGALHKIGVRWNGGAMSTAASSGRAWRPSSLKVVDSIVLRESWYRCTAPSVVRVRIDGR